MKLADFAIKHPAIITIILIALILFGIISLRGLRQDMLSDINMPSVVIFTIYPGAGPHDIEREVTDILEGELTTLEGINSMSSTSGDSASFITLEFDWETDIDIKIPEIREKINNVMDQLPDGIEGPPSMIKISPDLLPILSVSVTGSMDRETLTRFAEDYIVPSVSRVSGVAAVNLQGGVSMITDVRLDLKKLEARGISVLEVFQQLKHSNVSFPAGAVVFRDRELNVRTMGDFSSLQEIENLVVGYKDETFIRLKDVADVTIAEKDVEVYAVSDGEEIIILDIMKQQGSDTNEIIAEIYEILDSIKRERQGVIDYQPVADQSVDIKLAINSVKNSAILGGILAVVILFLFLHNLRTTLIIAVSIPLSIVFAFIAMSVKGQSLNIMTLGGLTVGIGMIVDSSIVVLENIHKNFRKSGDSKQAASAGTSEVGGAIIASTTTSLCVFIPMLFVKSYAGAVLNDVAWTIIYALSAALLVAIFVVPFLASKLLKPEENVRNSNLFGSLSGGIEKGLARLERGYRKALRWAIRNRLFVLLFAVSVLIISILAFDFIGFEFVPSTDMNELQISIETPQGYTLEKTREKVEEIEQLVLDLVPETEGTIFYVGQADSFGFTKTANQTFGRVRLTSSKKRKRDIFTIIDLLQREITAKVPDVNATVVNGGLGALSAMATGGQGFKIEVYGNNMDDVLEASQMVQEILKQDPNTTKTELNVSLNKQEIVSDLALDYMGNLGVTPYEAAVSSRIIFNGMETGKYRTEDRSYDIFLRSEIAGKEISEDIMNTLVLKSQGGKLITFANFADLSVEPTISAIHHENKMKSIIVTAYLKEPDVRGTSSRVTEKIREMNLPIGVNWEITGGTAEMMESFRTLLFSILIAVFLVYTVMVIQFERFTQPLIVMAAIPFTVIGVTAGLLIFGSTLSIVSFMGLIALAGIVVNNAIVLIDYINLLRRRDKKDVLQAILDGGSSRLKPILMTTLTTILGVLPLAFGLGEGAEMYSPLGQTIAGGLVTSTLITLFLVPVLYYILETRKERLQAAKAASGGQSPQPPFDHEDLPSSQGGDI
jgi:HAE1 family hydrophobic/amphiphilic exporter-1